jgi:hypothetical protein
MASLSPPISVQLTPRQLAWLDGRRRCSDLSRSAALRAALDALIQQEQGSGSPAGALERGGSGHTQLEIASTTPTAEI